MKIDVYSEAEGGGEACGVSRMDGMSNENVYERFGMCHVGDWLADSLDE